MPLKFDVAEFSPSEFLKSLYAGFLIQSDRVQKLADPYFSEIKYLGGKNADFIEVAFDPDTDISDFAITIYTNGEIS